MPILIDGHNLIGRLPTLSLRDPDDEEKLLRLLQPYRARARKSMTVVFDAGFEFAPSEARRIGGIDVVFAPHGQSADSVIANRVRRSRNPSGWLVVTSDRRLAETVQGLGARVRSADDFAGDLYSSDDGSSDWKGSPPTADEVDWWLDRFQSQD